MRTLIIPTALAVGLLACQPGGDLGGGDPGWELDDEPFGGMANWDSGDPDLTDEDVSLTVPAVSATCTDGGSTENALSVSVTGSDVAVEHSGLVTACEVEWEVQAIAYSSPATIAVDYIDPTGTTPSEEGCWCAWTVEYTISGVPTGDYTLTALSDTATLTIE